MIQHTISKLLTLYPSKLRTIEEKSMFENFTPAILTLYPKHIAFHKGGRGGSKNLWYV